MSTAQHLPDTDLEQVEDFFGPVMFSRGKEYAGQEKVLEITADDDPGGGFGQRVRGRVSGSGRNSYQVRLEIVDGDVDDSSCTCPVAVRCKHGAAVAIMLAAGTRTTDTRAGGAQTPSADDTLRNVQQWAAARGFNLGPASGVSTTAVERPEPGTRDWRQELGALRWSEPDNTLVPLAVRFELQARTPASWYARRQSPQLDVDTILHDPELRVAMRILRPGKRENWIKGGLNWRSMIYPSQVGEYQRAHVDVLARIYRLFLSEHEGYGTNGETIGLEQFGSGLVWSLVDQAQLAGVTFVTSAPLTGIAFGTAGHAELDIRARDDAMVVNTAVFTDGDSEESAGPDSPRLPLAGADNDSPLHLVGAVAVGELTVLGQAGNSLALTIHPLADPLRPTVRAIMMGKPIHIATTDADEFFTDFYPRIADQVQVTSSDESVTLPEPQAPSLRLTLSYAKGDALTLDWSWDYPGGRTMPFDYAEGHGRDRSFEAYMVARVRQVADWLAVRESQSLAGVETAEFTHTTLPRLETLAELTVEIRGDQPTYFELTAKPHITVTADKVDTSDWLDLGFEITVEGRKIPFPELFKALATGARKLKLPDNSFFSLQHPAFDKLKALLDEADALGEWDPQAPKLGKRDIALWEELDELADESDADAEWLDSVQGLRSMDSLPHYPVPPDLDASLREYQQTGYEWLHFLYDHGLGGILADDMGLGKTMQTLALIVDARVQAQGSGSDDPPFLVVAPSSVIGVWKSEAARFAPGLDVRVVDTTTKKSRAHVSDRVAGADVVITSYTILRIDQGEFAESAWAGLVLDEAQFVKNRSAQVHQAAARVEAPFKLAITGTPMENSLTDLWALLNITVPGLFHSAQRFRQRFVRPIESGEAPQRMDTLRKRVRPFMLRRTKEQVAGDLPEKQEQVATVELEPAHRKLYDAVLQRERKKILGLVDDMDKNRFIVFRSLTLLRMMALDPAIVDEAQYSDMPSSKMSELLARLHQVIDEGHRVLVFSQFTSFLQRIADALAVSGIEFAYLDGSTRDRSAVIEGFRNGDQAIFLISLKAGGFGVTLTEADYVFLLDPWWNPAAESQAIDRAHRIGQDKRVMVYRMVSQGTIEEKVLALQRKKAELFSSLVDDETAFSTEVTADDIRGLFSAE